MTTTRPLPRPLTTNSKHTRPNSAVYIGPPSLNPLAYTSLLSATPPELPEPPEPPSPISESSSVGSGLPSPPATNSTGSGSTRGLNGAGGGGGGSGDDDDTARFGTVGRGGDKGKEVEVVEEDGNGDVLKRVKSLQERNRLALDKLSSYSLTRNTPSPRPPPSSSSAASSTSSGSNRPAVRSRHSYTVSLSSAATHTSSSRHKDLSGSETERENSHNSFDIDDDEEEASPSPSSMLLNHTSSTISFKTPGRPTTPSASSSSNRTSSNNSQTLSPRFTRTRLISAPASPGKALSSISRSTSGSGSGSGSAQAQMSPRKRASLVVELGLGLARGDRDREDVASRALAAVASSRRGLTPINAGTGTGSARRRQPLPKEFWESGSSVTGSGSGTRSESSYGEEILGGSSTHAQDKSLRHLSRSPSPSPPSLNRSNTGFSTSQSARNARPHTATQSRYPTNLTLPPADAREGTRRRLPRRPSQSEDLGNRTASYAPNAATRSPTGRRQTTRPGGSAESALTVQGSGRLVGEGLRAAGLTLRGRGDSPVLERERERGGRGRESPVFERNRGRASPVQFDSDVFRDRDREREERLERIRAQSQSRTGYHSRAATSMEARRREGDWEGDDDVPQSATGGLRAYKSAYPLDRDRAPSRTQTQPQDGIVSPFGTTTRRYASITPLNTTTTTNTPSQHVKSASSNSESQREHTKLLLSSLDVFDQALSRYASSSDVRRSIRTVIGNVERLNGMMRAGTGRMLEGQVECEVREATGNASSTSAASEAEIYRRVGGEYREALRVSDELVRGMTEMMLALPRLLREGAGGDRVVVSPENGRSDGGRSRPGTSMAQTFVTEETPARTSRQDSGASASVRRQDTGTQRRLQLMTPRELRDRDRDGAPGGMSTFDSQETIQATGGPGGYEPSPTPATRIRTTTNNSQNSNSQASDSPITPNTNTQTLSRRRTTNNIGTLRATPATATTTTTGVVGEMATFSRSSSSGMNALRQMRERSISNSSEREKEEWEEFGYHNGVVTSQSTSGVRRGVGGIQRAISGSETEREPPRNFGGGAGKSVRMSFDGSAADRAAAVTVSAGIGGSGKRERRRTVVDMWPKGGQS
ncbi:cell wall surface anchor family protein [Moniliophthora roreri MCA 2997]|uniref:Cell wall surface anchor family protein n=1 Tax=Moniliophthora roreri (strain MCA 2997) TaxID=1381753 RepID=V2YG46_MONRO|nr:cell wall surface anchor family protein [Moniliophthora roreri MCA 2997]KAI3597492.1 cell wall surface anchor family protein [Moniliophthora roreri]